MKIYLVEGQQKQLQLAKSYPLGRKDKDFLDIKYNKLYTQGRISFLDKLTLIIYLVFIVQQLVNSKKKGQVVVNLQLVNVVTILDIYPLLDQDNIIGDLTGKKQLTVFNAIGFFHQLPVAYKHQNRIVVISLHSLKRLNIVLIGFKNSPAFIQRFIDCLFQGKEKFVRAYINNIVIFSETKEEHLQYLKEVIEVLDKARVYISTPKSFAIYLLVQLLRYIVNSKGVAKTDNYITIFKKLKFPNTLDDLEHYLSIARQLRKGILQYTIKSALLQDQKTKILAKGREDSTLPQGKAKNAYKAYISKARFVPIQEELDSFCLLQEHLCTQYFLYHY